MSAVLYVAVSPAFVAERPHVVGRHVMAHPVFETAWLSKRLHIDLLRMAGAVCCASAMVGCRHRAC